MLILKIYNLIWLIAFVIAAVRAVEDFKAALWLNILFTIPMITYLLLT